MLNNFSRDEIELLQNYSFDELVEFADSLNDYILSQENFGFHGAVNKINKNLFIKSLGKRDGNYLLINPPPKLLGTEKYSVPASKALKKAKQVVKMEAKKDPKYAKSILSAKDRAEAVKSEYLMQRYGNSLGRDPIYRRVSALNKVK